MMATLNVFIKDKTTRIFIIVKEIKNAKRVDIISGYALEKYINVCATRENIIINKNAVSINIA